MDIDTENVLKLMFSEGVPDGWIENSDFCSYVSKLGVYSLDKLCKEPDHLDIEKGSVLNQTQELAFANYKTFIKTAECSRELFQQFQKTETRLDCLTSRVPQFSESCQVLLSRCSSLDAQSQATSLALKRHSDLLHVLELPQLLESAVRSGLVEESLALIAFAQRLAKAHPNIPILQTVSRQAETCSGLLTVRLFSELRGELSLPRCLLDVGVLRRMGSFSEAELRLKFLQARDYYLENLLTSAENEQGGATKKIELYRSHLFNTITQYRGVFPESNLIGGKQNGPPLLEEWVNSKVNDFLSSTTDWSSETGAPESLMYLGQSLGRVGADVRALAAPLLLSGLTAKLEAGIGAAAAEFPSDMDRTGLIGVQEELCGSNIPFYPLAKFTNGLLSSLNLLRHCAPLCLAHRLTVSLQQSLISVATSIAHFYTREQQALGGGERELLTKLVVCFADQLVPHIQTCLHTVYPPADIAHFLSIPIFKLQAQGLTYLDKEKILAPVHHLLPVRMDKPSLLDEKQPEPPSLTI